MNSITTKSADSPSVNLEPSDFSRCLYGTKAERSSLKFIIAPFSTISAIFELWILSTAKSFSYKSQGLSFVCLWPRLNFLPSKSRSRTITSIISSMDKNSEGCFIFLDQERSEI